MTSENAILDLIKKSGPLLPVEVSNKFDFNSYVANAYLGELVNKGLLKKSSEAVGSAFLFYVDGQDGSVRERLVKLKGSKAKTAGTYATNVSGASPEVIEKRKRFVERLKEIEDREEKVSKQTIISELDSGFSKRFEVKEKVEEARPIAAVTNIIKRTVSNLTRKPEKVDLIGLAEDYLKENSCVVLERGGKNKKNERNYLVETDSALGKLNFLVKIKDKKSINEADLSLAYTDGLKNQIPVLFLTIGKLTKTAEEYLKKNHMIRVKILGK